MLGSLNPVDIPGIALVIDLVNLLTSNGVVINMSSVDTNGGAVNHRAPFSVIITQLVQFS